MRLGTHVRDGRERPCALDGDDVVVDLLDADGDLPDTTAALLALAEEGRTRVDAAIASGRGRAPLSSVHLGPAVRPQKLFGIGLNYLDHAQEANREPTPCPTRSNGALPTQSMITS